jgi:uncharacterized protein (DUF2126 family)
VDADLAAGDVRLTIGGEPTFIADDDFEAPEWNSAAVGPTKAAYADKLIRLLRERFAPGSLLHHGQGKWYPGESLPRWGYSIYWRADGVPIWRDPSLIAGESRRRSIRPMRTPIPGAATRCRDGRGVPDHRRAQPGRGGGFVQPVYEDAVEWIVKEAELPANTSPTDPQLDDPEVRQRFMRTFQRGLTKPVGYVLPVQRWHAAPSRVTRWQSERWKVRRGALYAVPGDSALGYRLPLGSLPFVPPSDYPYIHPRDTAEPREPLADFRAQVAERGHQARRGDTARSRRRTGQHRRRRPGRDGAAPDRTGRDRRRRPHRADGGAEGRLPVGVPAAGGIAGRLSRPDRGGGAGRRARAGPDRGYPPPPDPRLTVLKITPDPGVIEVNIQPAKSWREAVEITETLYECARGGADGRQVHGRWPRRRHRRRQPYRAGRADPARFAVHPPAGPAQELRLYWQRHPRSATCSRAVHRPDQPGAAHRRGAARCALRTGDRAGAGAQPRSGRTSRHRPPGWWTACSATCWST